MTSMAYTDRFVSLDGLVEHLDTIVPLMRDHFLISHYVGFLNVSIVTVWELSVKDIFLSFAAKKHRSFGTYCGNVLEKMNGRISVKDLKDQHIRRFGEKYLNRFTKLLEVEDRHSLGEAGISIKAAYGNVIVWRNSFAHEGVLPVNASYAETRKGYEAGKVLLACLSKSMTR